MQNALCYGGTVQPMPTWKQDLAIAGWRPLPCKVILRPFSFPTTNFFAYDNIEQAIIYHCVISEANTESNSNHILAAFMIFLLLLRRHLGFPEFHIVALCCIYWPIL